MLSRFDGKGRGHWGRAYSNFLAGTGLKRGNIIGRTDAIGATVADRPLTPKNVLATIFHLIGINPNSTLNDRLNRPVPLCHDGKVIPEMLGQISFSMSPSPLRVTSRNEHRLDLIIWLITRSGDDYVVGAATWLTRNTF